MDHTKNICSFVLLLISLQVSSQVSSDYAVLTSATYTEIPPALTIHWNNYPSATSYSVFRKEKNASVWLLKATLSGSDTAYTDPDISPGEAFEYRVHRVTADGGPSGEGYIYAGINLPAADYRGTSLIVLDTSILLSSDAHIQQLMQDISGDGWAVKLTTVSRYNRVDSVKNCITSAAIADTTIHALLLLGHVPVPYSGNLNPDGHPDHQGAWPFDGYYADTDGSYTDETVDNSTASREANHNIPGDGKFDQSLIAGKTELETGRVDMYDLPSFAADELTLLKQYLQKDHDFRTANTPVSYKGLIDDNFGAFYGEAFASDGWRNFSPALGSANVVETDLLTTLQNQPYIWAYGCGGGWYQGASGVATTADLALDSLKGVFTMLFGSYFGDWDNTDNFLRAPLAAEGSVLTSVWAGRPYWQFHHMVLGENIGYSTRLTQNNSSVYTFNYCAKCVQIALMGDPTLQMFTVRPVADVSVVDGSEPNELQISWSASSDTVDGYYIYRSDNDLGIFHRISDTVVTTTEFTDDLPLEGMNHYMVRPVKLQQTASGSFYALGNGRKDSAFIVLTNTEQYSNKMSMRLYPNPASENLRVEVSSILHQNELLIYDMAGTIVQRQMASGTSIILNLADLPAGLYTVSCGGERKKLIVSR